MLILTTCGKIFRRFAISTKMADTRGCYRCCVVSNSRDYQMYLCAAMPSSILLMQWYDPLNKFSILKVGDLVCCLPLFIAEMLPLVGMV